MLHTLGNVWLSSRAYPSVLWFNSVLNAPHVSVLWLTSEVLTSTDCTAYVSHLVAPWFIPAFMIAISLSNSQLSFWSSSAVLHCQDAWMDFANCTWFWQVLSGGFCAVCLLSALGWEGSGAWEMGLGSRLVWRGLLWFKDQEFC